MKILVLCTLLFCVTSYNLLSQVEKTKELVKEADLKSKGFKGYFMSSPFLLKSTNLFENEYLYYYLKEKTLEVHTMEKSFNLPSKKSDWRNGFLEIIILNNNNWIYSLGFMSDDYKIYYQNIWLQYGSKDYFLDSIYNADKIIHSSFSSDGKYLLVNSLNTLSDYYNPEQDNRIMVYGLKRVHPL